MESGGGESPPFPFSPFSGGDHQILHTLTLLVLQRWDLRQCQYKSLLQPTSSPVSTSASGHQRPFSTMIFRLVLPLVGLILAPTLASLNESQLKELSAQANVRSAEDEATNPSRKARLFYISSTSVTTTISTQVSHFILLHHNPPSPVYLLRIRRCRNHNNMHWA